MDILFQSLRLFRTAHPIFPRFSYTSETEQAQIFFIRPVFFHDRWRMCDPLSDRKQT